jgi:hypothetical protein
MRPNRAVRDSGLSVRLLHHQIQLETGSRLGEVNAIELMPEHPWRISCDFFCCSLLLLPKNKDVVSRSASPQLKRSGEFDKMESANGTRRRRLPVSSDPAHLQVLPEAHSSTDFRTNISRLEEATRRLNSYVTSQLNSEAVAAELRFIEQTVHGIRRLTQHPTDHWPYR